MSNVITSSKEELLVSAARDLNKGLVDIVFYDAITKEDLEATGLYDEVIVIKSQDDDSSVNVVSAGTAIMFDAYDNTSTLVNSLKTNIEYAKKSSIPLFIQDSFVMPVLTIVNDNRLNVKSTYVSTSRRTKLDSTVKNVAEFREELVVPFAECSYYEDLYSEIVFKKYVGDSCLSEIPPVVRGKKIKEFNPAAFTSVSFKDNVLDLRSCTAKLSFMTFVDCGIERVLLSKDNSKYTVNDVEFAIKQDVSYVIEHM